MPLTMLALLLGAAPSPEVAVLVEPGLPRYGAQPTLRPEKLPEVLAAAGLRATAVRVGDLARLDPRAVPVLVLAYGNAFPLPALEALRAYHRAGGSLIVNGIPFCHPCEPLLPAGWSSDGGEDAEALTWLPSAPGGRAIRVTRRIGAWRGVTSPRIAATPGQRYRISAQVRSSRLTGDNTRLYVRSFRGGEFLGQDGPAVPSDAGAWTPISAEITVHEKADAVDVSLQVWTADGWVELAEPSLRRLDAPAAELLPNPGLTEPGDAWRDLGHVNYFGPEAMGTGGFRGPAPGTLQLAADNPLGLTTAQFAPRPGQIQSLDTASLPAGATVVPLVELVGDRAGLGAALIQQSPEFGGGRVVYLGQVASSPDALDAYFLHQTIARGAVWALGDRLAADRRAAILARVAAQPAPRPLPSNLEIVAEPRPWGDTFFPKSPPPARELLTVDVRGLPPADKLALISLQGLTSRTQPRLWLTFSPWEERWLDWHRERGYLDSHRAVDDWKSLFAQFRAEYRGVVIPDTSQYQGVLLAVCVAGVEDLVIASPELATELGLPVVLDLRGRFATYAEGLRWLWSTYRDRLSHHLLSYAHPDTVYTGNVDYDIAHRGLVFWISGDKDGDRPGADPLTETSVMGEILAALPPNIGMRGFPWHGEGFGMGEGGGVEFCGGYGKGLVCCNLSGNQSVMSGVQVDRLVPPPRAQRLVAQRDKVYIALTMSDGDNLNTWLHYFGNYFDHPAQGRLPMGWGMGPAALDLIPAVAEWYYQEATPNDEFLADVSGIAYIFPETYGHRYRDRQAVYAGFLDWTARYLDRTGMATIRPHGGSVERLDAMAAALPMVHSIFADYARRGLPYDQAVRALPDGRPVFHALTHWHYGAGGLLRDIREQVGARRPAFVNAFLHNWTFDMDALQAAYDQRDADMVFVTPSQLADLWRQARDQGWTP